MLKHWTAAGTIAGLAVFLWGAVSHMALGLGDSAIKKMPQEEALMAAMGESIKEPGLYFFPYFQDMSKMADMYTKYPHGLLFYSSAGTQFNFGAAMAKQVFFDIAHMWMAAWLLWMAAPAVTGFGRRVAFVAVMSLFAFFATDAPYWNWYEFPTRFIMDGLIDKLVGCTIGGAILAYLLGRKA